ncbi:MAG: hypothetical protein M1821_002410 [Bathelium mastoideum]|nr:MAG: hypothetical protein M1821_002410 [Bathelium mastoideum]
MAVYRAFVECLVMKATGSQNIDESELAEEFDKARITVSSDARNVDLTIPLSNGDEHSYKAISVSEKSPSTIGSKPKAPTASSGSSTDSEDRLKGEQSWLDVPLHDPDFKFTIVKRVMQLTGKRISDPIIQRSSTARELCDSLLIKPKPKKLFEALQDNETLSNLTNVKLREQRITPIDKDREVGRWKVIEQELLHRNLPVTGHGPKTML